MTPLAGMFPGDAMGSAELMKWAVQNPEMAAQLFAQTGNQPPEAGFGAGDSTMDSPFASMGEGQGFGFNPDGTPSIPKAGPAQFPTLGQGGQLQTTPSVQAGAEAAPDMSSTYGSEFPLVQAPVPTPGMAGMEAAANPFPTPIGEAQGNPFPTPIGSPAAPAGPSMSGLGDALKGISVPSAPEAQRVSTPAAPRPTPIGNSQMIEMLAKMMSGGQAQAQQQLRLGQSLPSPQIYR